MKHNKNLPVWIRVTPLDKEGHTIGVTKLCATIAGAHMHLLSSRARSGLCEYVQRDENSAYQVIDNSKRYVNGIMQLPADYN
jgi:hypothetical protein